MKSTTGRRWLDRILILGYLIFVVVAVASMFYARKVTLAGNTAVQRKAEWGEWVAAAAESNRDGPISRRVPKTDGPPAFILMQDYFAVCLTAVVIFGSLVYGVMGMMIRGVVLHPAPKIHTN